MPMEEKSAIVPIGATLTTLLTAATGGKTTITSLRIGHVDVGDDSSGDAAADATVDLALNKAGAGDVYFHANLDVAVGEAVVVASQYVGQIVLEDDDDSSGDVPDVLKARASAADTLVALLSYIEHT